MDRQELINELDDMAADGGECGSHAKAILRKVRDEVVLTNYLEAWVADLRKHYGVWEMPKRKWPKRKFPKRRKQT